MSDIYGPTSAAPGIRYGNASLHSGSLSPGAWDARTLTIVGDVKLAQVGAAAVDFAQPNGDKLQITGNLTLGADLGGGPAQALWPDRRSSDLLGESLALCNAPNDTAIVSVGGTW